MAAVKPTTRNWHSYNERLVQRGEILLRLDILRDWQSEVAGMNEGKRGRPFAYPKMLMLFFGMMRAAFHLPLPPVGGSGTWAPEAGRPSRPRLHHVQPATAAAAPNT